MPARADQRTPPAAPVPDLRAITVFACNLLGDSVCRLPAIQAAKRTYPGASLSVVADPRYRDVFADQPFIDTVWAFNRTGGKPAQLRAWAGLVAWIRLQRPDLVLDLYGSKRTALASGLGGARRRLGLHRGGASRWYNLRPPSGRPFPKHSHLIQQINSFASLAGISAPFAYTPLSLRDEDRSAAAEVLVDLGIGRDRRLVLLNPAARVQAKRWPPDRFAALARDIRANRLGLPAVVASPDAQELSEEIVHTSKGAAIALPPLPLKQLASLLERADALVTGDTGVLHVGAAMGAPAVILTGPTDPDLVAHPQLPQVVLGRRGACPEWQTGSECPRYNTCRNRRCIEAIAVEETLAAVGDLLRRGRDRPPPSGDSFRLSEPAP